MLWNSIGSVFYLGCQWLITILVVRLSTSYADAGLLSLAMSVSNALWGCASLNLRAFQVADGEKKRFTDGDFFLNRMLSCGLAMLICLVFVTLSGYSQYERGCIVAFMVFKVSEAVVDIFHGIDQKAWRLDIAGKSFFMRGISIIVAFIIGFMVFQSLLVAILLMCVAVFLIIVFYDYRVCKKAVGIQREAKLSKAVSLIRIGLPLGLYMSLLNIIGALPRISIEKILGEEMLGIFASISTPTVLIMQGASFVFNPLVGLFASSWNNRDGKGFRKVFLLCVAALVLIGVASVMFSIFFGEAALLLLFGESIRSSSGLLLPIVITAVMTAVIWFLGCVYTVVEDFSWIAWSTFASLLLCLFLSDYLVQSHQLMGAAIATGASLLMEIVLLVSRLTVTIRTHYKRHDEQ